MFGIRLLVLVFVILSAVVPTRGRAATFQEDFSADPLARGWNVFGETGLFHWNSAAQNLEVTWDSSKSNSYFHRPLGTILTKADDFRLAFDLRLRDIAVGTTPGKLYSFQIAVGLVKWTEATRTNFYRGTGVDSPSVAEFDYFPDSGFGATVSPTIISSNHQFATGFTFPFELTTNDLFHVEMTYTASNHTLATIVTSNGFSPVPIADAVQAPDFTDFRLDQLAVCSYSDAGQAPEFAGSVLAHGVVDNLVITTPAPPASGLHGEFVDGHWEVSFISRPDWFYTFERTANFQTWSAVSPTLPGDGGALTLADSSSNAVSGRFYRVRADRP